MLGTIDRDHVARLIALLASGDAAGIIDEIFEIDKQIPDYARLLEDLARDLQQIAVFQVVGSIDSDDGMDDAALSEFAASLSAADVQLFYQTALIGRRDLHFAPDPKSGAEMTLLRMLAFRPAQAGATAGSGGASGKQNEPQQPAAPAVAKIVEVQSASPVVTTDWQAIDWKELIPQLGLSGADRLLAGSCAYINRQDNTVFFSLDPASESYLTRQRKESLGAALSNHFDEVLAIDISIGKVETESPLREESRQADERVEAERVKLEADPNVQALKDMFGAELNPDSIKVINPPQND